MTAREGTTNAIITLTTDFGLDDPYVAEMKGVMLRINARASFLDVSHNVRPQRLLQAVFMTHSAWPWFPQGTVHIAVVDPGVGTDRRAVALVTPSGCFVGPDNGVLSSALPEDVRPTAEQGLTRIQMPAGYHAFAITNRRFMIEPVSDTFHGRDIFSPTAANLSLGAAPEELGEPMETLLAFPPLRAQLRPDGTIQAQVIHIDRFGNIVTDVRAEDLPDGPFTMELGERTIPGPVRTYAEAAGLAALVGGSGFLEVAFPNGNAAAAIGIDIGATGLLQSDR